MKTFVEKFLVLAAVAMCLAASPLSAVAALGGKPEFEADDGGASEDQPLYADDDIQAEAAYNLAIKYYQEGNIRRAVKWFRKASELGHAPAQAQLGYAYEKGEGIEQDYAAAHEWYQRSAGQKDREALCGLGRLYAAGHGVEKDEATAAKFFKAAAEQGSADAQYELGMLYMTGKGVGQNDEDAFFWLSLAARETDAAMEPRDDVETRLTKGQREGLWLMLKNWQPAK